TAHHSPTCINIDDFAGLVEAEKTGVFELSYPLSYFSLALVELEHDAPPQLLQSVAMKWIKLVRHSGGEKCTNCQSPAVFCTVEDDFPHPYPSGERVIHYCADHLRRKMTTDPELAANVLTSYLIDHLE